MNIERKSFIGIELKKDKPGAFTARIATLNVIDKDGDVTLPGAFPNGKTILISSYQHGSWMGQLPVGKGIIRETENNVLVEGEFNLASETGKEHYETIKFAPELQEWSYGFIIKALDEESDWNNNPKVWRVLKDLDVFEVSPVLRGAGVGTVTLAIKREESEGMTFSEQAETVLAAVKNWEERVKSLAELRRKEGRELSLANQERVSSLLKSLSAVAAEMQELLAAPDDSKGASEEAQKLYLEYLKIQNLLRGVKWTN